MKNTLRKFAKYTFAAAIGCMAASYTLQLVLDAKEPETDDAA